MRTPVVQIRTRRKGFSLSEVLVAAFILMVGAVAVTQAVPAAMNANLTSRFESTAVTQAQMEMDQMLQQPITATSFTDPFSGSSFNLGNCGTPGTIVGNTVKVNPIIVYNGATQTTQSVLQIDFSASTVSGYNVTRGDPNDPMKPQYDVRWAVVCQVDSGGTAVSKRYIVGVWKTNARQYVPPVTLDDTEQRYTVP